MTRVPCAAGFALLLAACPGRREAGPSPSPSSATHAPSSLPAPAPAEVSGAAPSAAPSAAAASSAAPSGSATPSPASEAYTADPKVYPWLAGDREFPKPDASLEARFPAPPGYTRVKVETSSFAEWLRGLPMAPEGTNVSRFDGKETLSDDDDYLAGVVAIDTGNADLQQSSDVIIRLHAEYLWSRGEKDKISYWSATRLSLPLSRWEKGQRLVADGANVFWVKGKPSGELDHAEFRRYLDAVFNWANSTSLASRSTPVVPEELTPGDFFLQSQEPYHLAVVLDLAEKPSGERVALLGQSRNPAESIHVVRPGKATPWFSVRPPVPVLTPHSKALNWSDLRRMPAGTPPNEPEK